MLKDKLVVNVGEGSAIYVQIHTGLDESELKYGDMRFTDEDKLEIWYGHDEYSEMKGWECPPWGSTGYSATIVHYVKQDRDPASDEVYRVLNDDPSFDEKAYLATLVEGENNE